MTAMRAAVRLGTDRKNPFAGLGVGDHPVPQPRPGWTRVRVHAVSLNRHDLWNLRGAGLPNPVDLPLVLGTDAAGTTDDGRPVIVYPAVHSPGTGDDPLDPGMTLLSDRVDGTAAEYVAVPSGNLVDKPAELSFVEAACLPTAYLTAYRMLFVQARILPGQRVLIQGAGGGVSTAAMLLARATGVHVTVAGRDDGRLGRALALGAHAVVRSGEPLAHRVHAVIETVGETTWAHSLGSLLPGGTVVVAGATSGAAPSVDLRRVYLRQLRVLGSTMGSRAELELLVQFLVATGVRPLIGATYELGDAEEALRRLDEGDVFGKVVLRVAAAGTDRTANPSQNRKEHGHG
jgi:NADPH:quinone reductase-like Zn-dependent oxidoreductase